MVVIDLVMRIADLSPILALRSLSTLELPYDGDSGLRVDEDADDSDTRILYVPGCEEPVVRAVTSGDRVRWEVLQPGSMDEDLRQRFLKDRILLEMVAETTVHLSTYGSIVVGWVVDHLVGGEHGYIFKASVAIVWFTAMLYISYWARKLLEDLPEDQDK